MTITHEICYNDINQGHIAGYSVDGDELWTVNSADSMNPADDSGQWLWSDEMFSNDHQWFDSMEDAIKHAKSHAIHRSA